MPLVCSLKNSGSDLTKSECERLEELARLFNMELYPKEDGTYEFTHYEKGKQVKTIVPADVRHKRLLAEICSASAPWVYFHMKDSCKHILFELPSERIKRVSELWRIKNTQTKDS